jgi:hemerythrin-like metal-binding protein
MQSGEDRHLSLGVPAMDQEHRQMAALVDDICNLPWPTLDLAMLEWRLQLLAEHTHEHFTAEEELMKARNYRNFEPHMLRHRALLAQLSILRTALTEGVLDWDHVKTIRLLRGWLIRHIHQYDRPFARYLHMIEKHAG